MNLSNQDVQLGQAMFTSSATRNHPLGTRGSTPDGRVYRYALCGSGAALAVGTVIQSPAIITGHLAMAMNTTGATGIGASTLTATFVSAAAVNLYAEGLAAIQSGTGQGYAYYIKDQPVATAGLTGATVNLYAPEDALVVAITTTAKLGLLKNKYSGVIVAPITTATGVIVGVATYIINAAEYGWIQTWGPTACLVEGTPALGAPVFGITVSAAGAVCAVTAAALLTNQFVGYMCAIGVEGRYDFVDLHISP